MPLFWPITERTTVREGIRDFLRTVRVKLPKNTSTAFLSLECKNAGRLVIKVTIANESMLFHLLLFMRGSSLRTPV